MLPLLNPRFGKRLLPNRRLTRAPRLNNRDRRRVGKSMSPQKVSLLQRRARRAPGPKYSGRYRLCREMLLAGTRRSVTATEVGGGGMSSKRI